MAKIYLQSKKHKTFYMDFRDHNKVLRQRVNTGVSDEALARSIADKVEEDAERLHAGKELKHPKVTAVFLKICMAGRSWEEFREQYRTSVLGGLAERTRSEVEDSLDRYERLMKPKAVADVSTEKLDAFIAQRRAEPGKKKGATVSPATINKDLRHLKAAFRAAVDWEYLRQAPKVRFQREAEKLPRYVTEEHFISIYHACDTACLPESPGVEPGAWWRALMVTLYMTGWRIGQTLALRRSGLDLEKGTLLSMARDNKGKRDQLVRLHDQVIKHLRELGGTADVLFPWPHDRRTLDVEWHRIQRAAKVKGADGQEVGLHLSCHGEHEHTPACHVYGFHDLRRAFATNNADRMTPDALQRLMQHASYLTTQRYIDIARQLAPAVADLYVPTLPTKTSLVEPSTIQPTPPT